MAIREARFYMWIALRNVASCNCTMDPRLANREDDFLAPMLCVGTRRWTAPVHCQGCGTGVVPF